LGNEAIVQGAMEAGVNFVSTYPGSPSSEIGNVFSKIAKKHNVYFEFSGPAFQIKSSWIHFEGRDGTTIHKHATGVDLGYLFDTLAIGLDDQCYIFPDGKQFCSNEDYELKFFVNGEQVPNISDYEIIEDDKILILYGAETPEEVEGYLLQLDNQELIR